MKLRAGLAHLWFVTVHPFHDGNGRVARAIADWQLARSENSAQRFYSMSAQIRQERNDYYDILEHTRKGTLDVTPWLDWAALAKCSHDTALRDIQSLIDQGLLKKDHGGGRSTSYSLDEG